MRRMRRGAEKELRDATAGRRGGGRSMIEKKGSGAEWSGDGELKVSCRWCRYDRAMAEGFQYVVWRNIKAKPYKSQAKRTYSVQSALHD